MLDAVRRRLVPIEQRLDPYGWLAALSIMVLAGLLRLLNLASPGGMIFDEVYYAKDAHALMEKGVEWNFESNSASYVVHPPLGKWLIGIGEGIFGWGEGTNTIGWRVSAAVFGTLTVLMIIRIAHRMFGSLLLACAAGILMAFDGMHFVLSRSALLDMFLMFFVLASFGALVIDRDVRRARWEKFIADGGDPHGKGRASRPPFAVPWWRLVAAVMIALGTGVKWSALAFLPIFVILVLWWEVGARRTAGVRHPIRDAVLDEIGWLVLAFAIMIPVYIATWTGWLVTDIGYNRHWLENQGQTELPIIGALQNLWNYHEQALSFHTGLDDAHQYASEPWSWLVLGRPVAFYWSSAGPCGADSCAGEVLLLGTPMLWWSFVPVIAATLWFTIARRDWRGAAILAMIAAAILPWVYYAMDNRTMFFFYALPAEPFLILAAVFVLGCIMKSPPGQPQNDNRLLVGTVVAGAFVLLVVLNFAYFYPIFTGESIPYTSWQQRMWISRWV